MSTEDAVTPEATTDADETTAPKTKLVDIDKLQRELDRARADAAKYRVEGKEIAQLEADAKKWQEHVDSQRTELERLQTEHSQLKEELETRNFLDAQRKIGEEAGLDPDLFEFVTGSDEDEMRAKAKKLADKSAPIPVQSADDLRAGNRGKPITPAASSGGGFLLHLADTGQ